MATEAIITNLQDYMFTSDNISRFTKHMIPIGLKPTQKKHYEEPVTKNIEEKPIPENIEEMLDLLPESLSCSKIRIEIALIYFTCE